MYSFNHFQGIIGPRLEIAKMKALDIDSVIESLYSETTWAVAQRGYNTQEKLKKYFEGFLAQDQKGEALPLVIRLNATQEIVAFSKFYNAPANFLKVEIGFSWIADRWMRTFVNTEKKFLMIQYAFEQMNVRRVEFSVDPSNEKSNKGMLRLGAKFEGMLRRWRPVNEKDLGDRNIYSIIRDEWPQTKEHLLKLLER